jgi:uncharacterized protein YbjT (DUF2867 family)
MNVLVIGATGSIGSLVVAEALRPGHQVRALVRSAAKARQLPGEAESVVGDLTRSETLSALPRLAFRFLMNERLVSPKPRERSLWRPSCAFRPLLQ